MRWEQAKGLKDKQFQRLTGIPHRVFITLIDVYKGTLSALGRKQALLPEDAVLLTVLYWRHYDVMALLAIEFGISEATVSRIVRRVEDALIKSKMFRVEGKKLYPKTDQDGNWSLSMQPSLGSKGRLEIRRITIVGNINDMA